MKILIIANPISGGGKGKENANKLALLLSKKGHKAELYFTGNTGGAKRRVEKIGTEFDCLVVVGGDGTVNEVVNGIPKIGLPPIIPYPQGTANILAKEMNIPENPEQVVEIIEKFKTRRMDLGKITYSQEGKPQLNKNFILTASSGFDAMVTEEVKKLRTGKLGYWGYLMPIINLLKRYRIPELQVTVDGAEPVQGAMVLVSNVKNYGGLFSITDKAECDSGHFDICVLQKGSIPALASYTTSAFMKNVSTRKDIVYLTGREIKIDSSKPVAVEVDGDYLCKTPVEIKIEPGAVSVVIN
ncbi:MAG: diacylglycerol kinase family lipid kinase [Planctomycetes bacterium]|nr:diacylglycerol kinase family lipid kinase [Planctomycetota bacterium]